MKNVPPEEEEWICSPCLELRSKNGTNEAREEKPITTNKIGNKKRQSTLHNHFEIKYCGHPKVFQVLMACN